MINKINDPESLKENDIITFRSPRNKNALITHRIIDIQKIHSDIFFSTKGDSNKTMDARTITINDILGKYENISLPFVGYIMEFLKTKIGFFLFFLIPILLYFYAGKYSFQNR